MATGCKIVSVDNDGNLTKFDSVPFDEFLQECFGADDCRLNVTSPTSKGRLQIYLVFGNSPGELVCDHHVDETLNDTIQLHSDLWADTVQLTQEVP